MVSRETFKIVINIKLNVAQSYGLPHLDINAGELHSFIGGYPNANHRMPQCNAAMRESMINGDMILSEPPSGQGASLTIRYLFPR